MKFPYSTWLIKRLEEEGMKFSEFETFAENSLISSSKKGFLDIERRIKTEILYPKNLSKKNLDKLLLEENIRLEFEPITKQEYHLILNCYNNICTVDELFREAIEEDEIANNVFGKYKEGDTIPIKKALQDVILYTKQKYQ